MTTKKEPLQEKEIKNNSTKSELKKEDNKIDLSPFVTNVEGNVYAITGLPEEFIATLFAWVSRSSKSFKTHLEEAITEFQIPAPAGGAYGQLNKKAKDFHEKWTVGYGHSSVAEHATAHVGIEGVSRLASAELELANTFLSITEYSQRYQKPERGKWHNPFSGIAVGQRLDQPSSHELVEEFYQEAFDVFEKLIDGVYTDLKKKFVFSDAYQAIKDDQKKVDRELNALMKLAFEDARYVLPLAMHTQLGMTANGRAWRDALAVLGNSDHHESIQLSKNIKEEVTKVLPVLLKYATPSAYQKNSKRRLHSSFSFLAKTNHPSSDVQLGPVISEKEAINTIFSLLNMKHLNQPYETTMKYASMAITKNEKSRILQTLLFDMKHFDAAPPEFNHVRYSADLLVSEANWHQLLRHNRKTDFTFGSPTPKLGLKIPPRIVEAGLQDLVKGIAVKSEALYNELVAKGFNKEAEYVVLNAHKRLVHADFSLAEAYHLINLRTSDEAQWDIRETFEELHKQISSVHPKLMSQAKRRL